MAIDTWENEGGRCVEGQAGPSGTDPVEVLVALRRDHLIACTRQDAFMDANPKAGQTEAGLIQLHRFAAQEAVAYRRWKACLLRHGAALVAEVGRLRAEVRRLRAAQGDPGGVPEQEAS